MPLTNSSITPLRTVLLILQLKTRRLFNRLPSIFATAFKKKLAPTQRTATPRKGHGGILLSVFLGIIFMFNSINLSYHVIDKFKVGLGPEQVVIGAAFLITILCLAILFLAIGSEIKNVVSLDSDVEWLLSMPISIPTIYSGKVVEQTMLNIFGWFSIAPFLGCLLWSFGYRWSIPIIAVVLTLLLHFIISVLKFIIEMVTQRFFPFYLLRNIRALCLVMGTLLFFLVIASVSVRNKPTDYFFYNWARVLGPICAYLPTGVAVHLCKGADSIHILLYSIFLLLELVFIGIISWVCIDWVSKGGLEVIQSGYHVQRGTKYPMVPQRIFGMVGKELRLLMRDRLYLVQTLIMPLLLIGFYCLIYSDGIKDAIMNPLYWGTITFVISGYLLAFSVIRVLLTEQDALWILYTVPRPLTKLVMEKSWIWIGLAWLYSFVLFAVGVWYRGKLGNQDIINFVWIISGVPLLGIIGTALGILGSDPLAQEQKDRLRQDVIWLFMLLIGIFAGGLYMPGLWNKFVLIIMFVALALALWQKADGSFACLLDPTALPPRTLDLSDGLISAVIFFTIQSFFMVISLFAGVEQGVAVVFSYTTAGFLTVGVIFFTLWRSGVKLRGKIKLWSNGVVKSSLKGILAGGIIGVVGFIYLQIVPYVPFLKEQMQKTPEVMIKGIWLVLLYVVAAPLFEEIIFRGLIFNGLRRQKQFIISALISAVLFAIVHPPVSVIPVFLLGLGTAWTYEISGMLIAPISTHAIYNALILLYSSYHHI